jgi:hypothetical protein
MPRGGGAVDVEEPWTLSRGLSITDSASSSNAELRQ